MLDFLYAAVAWVLLRWHELFTAIGLPQGSGANWALSIVLLVITARLLLFRPFLKQLHYQRRMQQLQPRIAALRAKHTDDRAALQRELVQLQRDDGGQPLAGCLPLVLQLPVIIGLLHVLRHLSAAASPAYQLAHPDRLHLYGFSTAQTLSAATARIFGAPLAGQLRDSAAKIAELHGGPDTTWLVIVVLVILSAAATLATQVLARAAQTVTLEGAAATIARVMFWGIPLCTLGSGLFWPLGVLVYWLASNVWTAGQQAYVLRFHPPAAAATVSPPDAPARSRAKKR